jgi:hypothetical protein
MLSICAIVLHRIIKQPYITAIALGWAYGTYISLHSIDNFTGLRLTISILISIYCLLALSIYHGTSCNLPTLAISITAASVIAGICVVGHSLQQNVPFIGNQRNYTAALSWFPVSTLLQSSSVAAWYELSLIGNAATPLGKKGISELKRILAPWGLEHIIARSGSHIHLLSTFVFTGCMILPWWHVRYFLLLIILLYYGCITPLSIASLRALTFIGFTICIRAASLGVSPEARLLITLLYVSIIWPNGWLYMGTWLSFSLSSLLIGLFQNS